MPLTLATWLVYLVLAYTAVGAVFAVAFVWRGAGRIDQVARDGTFGFRLLILPGAAAFWPLLLGRWLRGVGEPPDETNDHRRLAADAGSSP